MRNKIRTIADSLNYLMERDGIKNPADLSRALYKKKILRYPPRTKNRKEREQSAARTISLHLNGKNNITSEWIERYCDLFDCSADFLLGYISLPTPESSRIHDVTGLSESSIKVLFRLKKRNRETSFCNIISQVLEHPNLEYFLSVLASRISYFMAPPEQRIIEFEMDGKEIRNTKEGLLDSIFQTHLLQDLPDIAAAYSKKYRRSPDDCYREYANYITPYKEKFWSGELTEKEYISIENQWLNGGDEDGKHQKKK